MKKRQEICATAALLLFILAAGCIETHTAAAFALLGAAAGAAFLGKLDHIRVTVEDIERRYDHAAN